MSSINIVGISKLIQGADGFDSQDLERKIIAGDPIVQNNTVSNMNINDEFDNNLLDMYSGNNANQQDPFGSPNLFGINNNKQQTSTQLNNMNTQFNTSSNPFNNMNTQLNNTNSNTQFNNTPFNTTSNPFNNNSQFNSSSNISSVPAVNNTVRFAIPQPRRVENTDPFSNQLNTDEYNTSRIINNVLPQQINFSLSSDQQEDEKIRILEQITQLRESLTLDAVDITSVPVVDRHSPFDDIRYVHKVLRIKNDRHRYCDIAEQIILMMASGLEFYFDGKHEFFGRKPDLTGWSDTVKMKLNRMRFDTSSMVSSAMSDFKISPGWRLLLELAPSAILHSSLKKSANYISVNEEDYAHTNKVLADIGTTNERRYE